MKGKTAWWDEPASKSISFAPSCYTTHKPLKIGDTGLEIRGGSCSSPIKDCEIYIGFDGSMKRTELGMPWSTGWEILYKIDDMNPPKETVVFKKLVSWTAEQLKKGRKVHCGCIGGHGRTGLFLAALVKEMTGIEDAITYVRDNYCKKAVETSSQVDYLVKQFGIKPVTGAKSYLDDDYGSGSSHGGSKTPKKAGMIAASVKDENSIWGKRLPSTIKDAPKTIF